MIEQPTPGDALPEKQRLLNHMQISAFYHDEFVKSQVVDFSNLVISQGFRHRVVVDIGGGFGYFAEALQQKYNINARVIDLDPLSIKECRTRGVDARQGDAFNPPISGDEEVVCFNLILHHLVGRNEAETKWLQTRALQPWRAGSVSIFVNEYIYESWLFSISPWLIYRITSSKFLSLIAGAIAKFVPSLRANTFRTGVRFRSSDQWLSLFHSAGFRVVAYSRGPDEVISTPRRLLLIKSIRRDSYLIESLSNV